MEQTEDGTDVGCKSPSLEQAEDGTDLGWNSPSLEQTEDGTVQAWNSPSLEQSEDGCASLYHLIISPALVIMGRHNITVSRWIHYLLWQKSSSTLFVFCIWLP